MSARRKETVAARPLNMASKNLNLECVHSNSTQIGIGACAVFLSYRHEELSE